MITPILAFPIKGEGNFALPSFSPQVEKGHFSDAVLDHVTVGGGSYGDLDVVDGLGHGLADEVEPGDLGDSAGSAV